MTPAPATTGATGTAFLVSLILLCIAAIAPLAPEMPAASLDHGWMFGMNAAVESGLVFGPQMTFTFGPYAAIFSLTYGPATDGMVLAASTAIAVALGCGIACVTPVGFRWAGLLFAVFLIQIEARDALLLALPAVFAVLAVLGARDPLARVTHFILLPAAMALLSLTKGSLLIGAAFVLAGGLVLALFRRKPAEGLIPVASFVLVLVLSWAAAGQPLTALPAFVALTGEIIRGYSNAMATPALPVVIAIYVAVAATTIVFNWRAFATEGAAGLVLLGLMSGLFFLGFKAAFVRMDEYHVVIAGCLAPILAWLLWLRRPGLLPAASLILSLGAYVLLGGPLYRLDAAATALTVPHRIAAAAEGLAERVTDPAALRRRYEESLAAIRRSHPLPQVTGPADIYSTGQSALLAHGIPWSPRPVLQSYSAYTPRLAEINASHLRGPRAPETLFFAIEPIDRRLAALEDGLSWPAILALYEPAGMQGPVAILRRRAVPLPEARFGPAIPMHRIGAEEWLTLPTDLGPLWASITLRPTLAGRFAGIAFRLPLLWIEFEFADGRTTRFRYLPDVAETGFLIAPVVETTNDFLALAAPEDGTRDRAMPVRVRLQGESWAGTLFAFPAEVELRPVSLPGR